MVSTKYHIISLSNESILVVLKSWERFEYYLDELELDLSSKFGVFDIYFDFLMKNGLKDRYFKAVFFDGKINLKSIKNVSVDENIKRRSNMFFSKHMDIIDDSLMTRAQKFIYKRELKLL